ncbi:MAG: Cu(I)/Ag(I) efflux system membrane fusion protein [Phenylobacterium sp.]|jgi:Cu(I)/Ag(I) efflux system membrane fusion protein
MMNKSLSALILLLLGFAAGYFFVGLTAGPDMAESDEANKEPEILYWVAPMDANYRRDKPGQSPMGMDLVPVYAKKEQKEAVKKEKKILYWVAPMDANYRRDKPGQSPMGMDLVPVYEEFDDETDIEGAIRINANVENNIGVRVKPVSYGPLQQMIDTVGYIGFDQNNLWHVHPRVEGWVENLAVTAVGDKVKEGSELFSIYSPTLVNAQEEFLTGLKRSASKGEWGGKKIIESSKARLLALGISSRQIDQLIKTKKVSQLVTIYARFDGYITELNMRDGQYVRPADKIISVGKINTVWVMTEVFERQAAWLKMGLPVTMTTAHQPGKTWQGKIDHVHPFLDKKTRTMRVRLHFDNADEILKPNMFVKVRIETASTADVISVPAEALIRTGKQDRVVLSLGNGQYKSVAVIPGRESARAIEIVRGLRRDDVVVTSAHFLLDSESSVTADFSRLSPDDRIGSNDDGR